MHDVPVPRDLSLPQYLLLAKDILRPVPHVAPTIPPRTVDWGDPSTAQGEPCVPPRWHAVNLCCAVMTDVHGVVRILSCVTTACTYLVGKACKHGQNLLRCHYISTEYCWEFHRPTCQRRWSPGVLLEQARRCRRGPGTRRYYHRPNTALPPTCCSIINWHVTRMVPRLESRLALLPSHCKPDDRRPNNCNGYHLPNGHDRKVLSRPPCFMRRKGL